MKKMTIHTLLKGLLISGLFLSLLSCVTVPVNLAAAYYLPSDGDRVLYLDGSRADDFLRPMADSLNMEDYEKIRPIMEKTARIYLVTRDDVLYVQGQGDYNRGFINFFLGANREWEKEKIGPFKAYHARSAALQIAFPDNFTFLISNGSLSDLLDSYYGGGTQEYPFDPLREREESLLLRLSLDRGNLIPLQSFMKTNFRAAEMALSPGEDGRLLMDVRLEGEEKSGKLLGSALKLFLLASLGRDVMKASLETGSDYALMSDIPVDYDFLLGLIGI